MNEILNKLVDSGYEAYIVGGYVRDLLLNRPSFDIDICTNATIDVIEKIFNKAGKSFKDYYSYHIKDEVYNYEITTFRKELEYKDNKPIKLVPVNDLYTDLLRRDFTINSLAIDKNNNLIDLLDGKKDLDKKVIKVIGDTYDKFIQDKTRIVRSIKFACLLDFDLDNEIKYFLSEKGHIINELNSVYIKNELDIIFKENPNKFFHILNTYKLKEYFKLRYENIIITKTCYGIWAQIECDFTFKREEKIIINNIKKLVSKNEITKYDIYKYGELVSLEASLILGIDINDKIDSLKIHSIFDIDIKYDELIKYKDLYDINKLLKNIEKNIVLDKLNNNKCDIINFIEGEYHE